MFTIRSHLGSGETEVGRAVRGRRVARLESTEGARLAPPLPLSLYCRVAERRVETVPSRQVEWPPCSVVSHKAWDGGSPVLALGMRRC